MDALAKEGGSVNLLIAAEAGGAGEDGIRQLLAEERFGDLVGLGGQVDVLKLLRVYRLGNEPGVDEGNFKVGIVGIVRHFQVDLAILPCLAGVEHGGIFLIQERFLLKVIILFLIVNIL